jgi:predicted restriction endonuclease
MKIKPTPLSTGKNMMITEYYKCKICGAKVLHVFTMAHLYQHHDKLKPVYYTPMKNK